MGSQLRLLKGITQILRYSEPSAMSWTWKGVWGDDRVYRFKQDDFFQSGRHKAEERFWVNYIHNDGSFYKPLRSRLSSTASSYGTRSRYSSSGSSVESETAPIQETNDKKIDEEKTEEELETENEDAESGADTTKDDDKMSSVTCLSCSKCSQPIKNPEKERYVSRMM